MKKAFIFDVDGVIINSEPQWEIAKKQMYVQLFGEEIYKKLGLTIGINIDDIYKKAVGLGASVSYKEYNKAFFSYAPEIYKTAPIPRGIDELGNFLIENQYLIAAVSASPIDWVNQAIERLSFKNEFKIVLSLHERPDLAHKPAPDGYLEAIKELAVSPSEAIALEDSNAGITSAKAAGIYVIGLRENLIEGQTQSGADAYADTTDEVVNILKNISK